MNRCPTSLIIGDTQIKTTVKDHVIPVRRRLLKRQEIRAGEDVDNVDVDVDVGGSAN